MPQGCLSQPKAHLYVTAVACSGSLISCSTHFPFALRLSEIPNHMVSTTNSGYSQPRTRNTGCTKLFVHTQPINCKIIAHKGTMILYMVQAPQPFNNPVVVMFLIAVTILAVLQYSKITDKYYP